MNAITDIIFIIYLLSALALLGLLLSLLVGARYAARHLIVLLGIFFVYITSLFTAQFIFTSDKKVAELFVRSSFVFAGFILPALYVFLRQRLNRFRSFLLIVLSILTTITGILSALPQVSSLNLIVDKEGIAISNASVIYNLLILGVLGGFLVTIVTLHRKQPTIMEGQKGALIVIKKAFIVALALNLVGAILSQYTWSQILTPISMTFLGIMMYIAIFKHQLFNIRVIIARSIAYLLSTFSIILIYVLLSFFLIDHFIFPESNLSLAEGLVLALLAVFLTFTIQPMQRFFNRTSNELFYQDAYDPQQLLDKLNAALVSNIEINNLLLRSSNIIAAEIKANFCVFTIQSSQNSQNQDMRFFGGSIDISQDELKRIHDSFKKNRSKVKVPNEDPLIDELMHRFSIGLIAKLSTHNSNLGFLFMGDKKSGSPYSTGDMKVIDILADELAIAIQNSLRFEEIQQFNITLQEKVDEATKKLRHANVRLRELDATKDEFISMASHQLRTPLTTIKGYLSMILDGDVGKVKAEEKDMVQHAFDSAQHMVYLIADLLNVSRLQSGKFVIDNKPTNLPEVVEGEVQQLKEQASNRKITMHYTAPKEFPTLNLDETKMRQVIMNFLDNALYYTPAGGEVTAELLATASTASFTVSDTGVGVPKDVQHHLFSKFYRADNARKMRPDGTGLGLYMAKKVIVAQGGAVIFKSAEGKGSTFGFSFPLSATQVKK